MFAKSENLGLELEFNDFHGVKSFGKEVFLGSTLNHSAHKSARLSRNSEKWLSQTV